jgi:ABC-type cobalamin/Fe3+-siderophores transport system ATPase subunit
MVNIDNFEIQDISVAYEDKPILRDISFAVAPGELIGIVGPNGAGKSTLLKVMRGFLPASSGSVTLLGRPAASFSQQSLARYMAFLPQRSAIRPGYTVRDMVMTGRYPHWHWWQHENQADRDLVVACMGYIGILSLAEREISTLSIGQLQRVRFAAILAQQAPIMLLDEPVSGLDTYHQEELLRFCRALCRHQRLVCLVIHELSLAATYCSRLILLGRGTTIADGRPMDVLTEANLSAAYGVPMEVILNPLTRHLEISGQFPTGTDVGDIPDILLAETERCHDI